MRRWGGPGPGAPLATRSSFTSPARLPRVSICAHVLALTQWVMPHSIHRISWHFARLHVARASLGAPSLSAFPRSPAAAW
eukprot:190251-Pyramimonas_sp.AAC.1